MTPVRVLRAYCMASLILAAGLVGSFGVAYANPRYGYTPPAPQVASPVVTVRPGVIFDLNAAHVNITFVAGVTAQNNITLPAYGKSLLIDSYNITTQKSPASYPGATMNFTVWVPTQTTIGAAVAVASVSVPSGTTTLYLNLSGLAANVFVFPLVDGTAQGGVVTNGAGAAAFSFWDWSRLTRTIEIDVGNVIGGPTTGPRLLASFSTSRLFSFLDASSDEYVQFNDRSIVPSNATVLRAWKFGDGTTSTQANPLHHYNYSLAATFNVTLVVCANGQCNLTTQAVTVARWHTLFLGLFIGGTFVASLILLWRYGGRTVPARLKKAFKTKKVILRKLNGRR